MNVTPASGESGTTLKRLLLLMTSGLLLLMLLGTLAANLYNLRQYMQLQLTSHAQDGATSLGLSLSTVVDARDLVAAGSMIDAIFDSGYYRSIELVGLDGQALVTRQSDMRVEGVPGWFIDWVNLATPAGKADVSSGWRQLGTLTVVSHPGFAYRDLWQLVKIQLAWFLVLSLLGYLVIQSLLSMILQPLHRIEAQADAIRQRDFSARSPVPKTRELQRVSHAMNSMAERLEQVHREQLQMIEDLREQSYRDPLTRLSNRAEFDTRLRAELESEQSHPVGSLLLLQVGHFNQFNQEQGRLEGDAVLKAVGQELRKASERTMGALVARRAGADFALYLPGLIDEQADQWAAELLKRLAGLAAVKQMCRNDVLHLGVASCSGPVRLQDLLAQADLALRQAQAAGPNGWQRFQDDSDGTTPVRPASEWLDILRRVLEQRALLLHFQPVYSLDRSRILHHQVLARIDVGGQRVVAGTFLPMAERFGLLQAFDQLVVETLLARLANDGGQDSYCLNLAPSSVATEGFPDWLLSVLERHRAQAARLVLEIPEYSLHYAPAAVERIAQQARALGCRIAIDRFGAAAVPFTYLQRLPLDFIKVDLSFVRNIHQSRENQFFLRTLVQIARTQAIQVVAVGVEFEQEWNVVEQLAVDAVMGYYLGRPQEHPVRGA